MQFVFLLFECHALNALTLVLNGECYFVFPNKQKSVATIVTAQSE